MKRLGMIFAVLLVFSAPAAAMAATSYTDVEDEVMCVSCNVPLNVAEGPSAEAEKAETRRMVAQGLSKQEIKDRLVEQYGPRVLALPEDKGFGIVVYVMPIVVVILLLGLVAVLLPRWRSRGAHDETPETAPKLSSADKRRLDADLRNYDS